jgi:hypothetical protein
MTFRVGQKVWRPIEEYEGFYEVSIYGEVISLRSGLFLKGSPIPGGYLTVALHRDGKQSTRTIHSLVAKAHIPNPDNKPSINHVDSDKTNNRTDNLEWCTPAENTRHGIMCGRINGAPRVLADAQAGEIRARYSRGHRMIDLAHEYEVSLSTIKNVIRGTYYAVEKAS